MSFDPEKVARLWEDCSVPFVRAEDFDSLLKMYRELQKSFAESIEARSGGIKNPQP